ncbi:hypothetical protein [Algoriphagus sediminis]|uniref:Uncharacterized protein n=1 Tax=Algoriphagus sediminis TaxID=3057113 RepID=A0ABT7Y7R9_9BACT|nr:hypothetical protein [Algoriphagus sediminis]MDN3202567.1 hypothetical protein [Algoriphagus sediminis]
MRIFLLFFFSLICSSHSLAQSLNYHPTDTLQRTIIQVQQDLYEVELNLHKAQKDLTTGIIISTIGYSVTILGGQLLGDNPDVGRALLYVGGATGITGTVFLIKGFKKLSVGPPRQPVYGPN